MKIPRLTVILFFLLTFIACQKKNDNDGAINQADSEQSEDRAENAVKNYISVPLDRAEKAKGVVEAAQEETKRQFDDLSE